MSLMVREIRVVADVVWFVCYLGVGRWIMFVTEGYGTVVNLGSAVFIMRMLRFVVVKVCVVPIMGGHFLGLKVRMTRTFM